MAGAARPARRNSINACLVAAGEAPPGGVQPVTRARYGRLVLNGTGTATGLGALPPLSTIGYEGTTVAAVLRGTAAAGVTLLLDVRAVAASRKPGFSKRQLAAELDAAGIDYVHLQGLGTPKPGRDAVRGRPSRAHGADLPWPICRAIARRRSWPGDRIGAGAPGLPAVLRARSHDLPSAAGGGDDRCRDRAGRHASDGVSRGVCAMAP